EPGVALLPLGQVLFVEGVGERQHRHEVAVLLEGARRRGADAVGGAVGGLELGMLGLELLQLAKQPVVLGIRQLRLVEDVVGLVRALDEPPQLGGPGGCGFHRPLASAWMTASATPTNRSSSPEPARGSSPSAQAPARSPNAARTRPGKASSARSSRPTRRTVPPVARLS